MSRSNLSWAQRLGELVHGDHPAETDATRQLSHRRGALAALLGGTAVVAVGMGGTARANNNEPDRHDDGPRGDDFYSIRGHENAHVRFLMNALGKAARPKPTFKNLEQKKFADFVRVSQALENTGVGAYLGAAPVILDRGYLAAAGSIALIEARHAGFLNAYLDDPITGNSDQPDSDNNFEEPLTDDEVVEAAGGFIKSLNGGPPVAYDDTPSKANDVKILNFALALEYLEADFYNINVPKFFRRM